MGGEWRLGDIVDYQMIAAKSFLEQSAKYREHYVMGRWQMASETIAQGETAGPGAYVIPIDQTDPVAAAEMVDKLILQGVEVHQTTEAFDAIPHTDAWDTPAEGTLRVPLTASDGDDDAPDDGISESVTRTFPAGSWIVFGAQPSRAAVLDLLEPRNRRLQREWPDGPFVRSYDGAAYTMPLQMGVEAIRIDAAAVGGVEMATSARIAAPPVPEADEWYAFSAKVTRSHQAAIRLLDGVSSDDLFLPTSLLRMELDTSHPLAVGSPSEVAAKWAGGRAYEPTGFGGESGSVRAVGTWAEDPDRLLMSGMLHGSDLIAGKAAILDVEYGSGRILMYGFRVQHRGQTHGTFKLLFNALLKNSPRATTEP